jgi:hypothetical protein
MEIVESIANPDGAWQPNFFGIIAPAYGREPEERENFSAFGFLIAEYLASLRKKIYVLDVSVPYAAVNGWPEEIAREEGRRKSGIFGGWLARFGASCETLPLESVMDWRKVVPSEALVGPGEIAAARKVSWDSPDERTLAERFRRYDAMRRDEYDLITRKYSAMTAKQSDPEEDELFDARKDGLVIPRIYFARPYGGRMFRPKKAELSTCDSAKDVEVKISWERETGVSPAWNAQTIAGIGRSLGLSGACYREVWTVFRRTYNG